MSQTIGRILMFLALLLSVGSVLGLILAQLALFHASTTLVLSTLIAAYLSSKLVRRLPALGKVYSLGLVLSLGLGVALFAPASDLQLGWRQFGVGPSFAKHLAETGRFEWPAGSELLTLGDSERSELFVKRSQSNSYMLGDDLHLWQNTYAPRYFQGITPVLAMGELFGAPFFGLLSVALIFTICYLGWGFWPGILGALVFSANIAQLWLSRSPLSESLDQTYTLAIIFLLLLRERKLLNPKHFWISFALLAVASLWTRIESPLVLSLIVASMLSHAQYRPARLKVLTGGIVALLSAALLAWLTVPAYFIENSSRYAALFVFFVGCVFVPLRWILGGSLLGLLVYSFVGEIPSAGALALSLPEYYGFLGLGSAALALTWVCLRFRSSLWLNALIVSGLVVGVFFLVDARIFIDQPYSMRRLSSNLMILIPVLAAMGLALLPGRAVRIFVFTAILAGTYSRVAPYLGVQEGRGTREFFAQLSSQLAPEKLLLSSGQNEDVRILNPLRLDLKQPLVSVVHPRSLETRPSSVLKNLRPEMLLTSQDGNFPLRFSHGDWKFLSSHTLEFTSFPGLGKRVPVSPLNVRSTYFLFERAKSSGVLESCSALRLQAAAPMLGHFEGLGTLKFEDSRDFRWASSRMKFRLAPCEPADDAVQTLEMVGLVSCPSLSAQELCSLRVTHSSQTSRAEFAGAGASQIRFETRVSAAELRGGAEFSIELAAGKDAEAYRFFEWSLSYK